MRIILSHWICFYLSFFLFILQGFVESHISPIEEDDYDHEYDEVPSDEEGEQVDKNSTPEVKTVILWWYCGDK